MALFKLVYAEKKAGDDKRYLYASTTGIPSDSDTKVIYDPTFTYGEGEGQKCFIYNSVDANGKPGFKVSTSKNQIPDGADVQTVAYATVGSDKINILTGEIYTPTTKSKKKKSK